MSPETIHNLHFSAAWIPLWTLSSGNFCLMLMRWMTRGILFADLGLLSLLRIIRKLKVAKPSHNVQIVRSQLAVFELWHKLPKRSAYVHMPKVLSPMVVSCPG